MTSTTDGHIVKRFDEEMQEMHDGVLQMGALARRQIRQAVKSLQAEDPSAARNVIERDSDVNELDKILNAQVEQILARRQPMASDLREILTIEKIATDLERVGDEASKIAQLAVHFFEKQSVVPNYQLLSEVTKTARFVESMLQESLEAFDEKHLDRACNVIRMGSELDGEFRTSIRHLTTFVMEDSRTIGHFIDIVLGIRALERIGGHAKNIGGYVIYLLTGRDVRHEPLDQLLREISL